MSDVAKIIREKFQPKNRYKNFGPCIREIRIQGFRGITDLNLDFNYPIVAFSGLNGAGKSTVGQLLACAYRRPTTASNYRRFYIKDFFPSSIADPSPFESDARVAISYETSNAPTAQEVTVSWVGNGWSGYNRQPERFCYYVGLTLYIPKIERRDLSIYRAHQIERRDRRVIPENIRSMIGNILTQPYDEIAFQTFGHNKNEVKLAMANRHGRQYSENNMGFGEGRALYMVDLLENRPEHSLFILEEPETSLHEDAQYKIVKYFLDVVNRRHHQIFMSTHSSTILDALPPEARKFIYRDHQGTRVYDQISATRARAMLSGGYRRSLVVCVEDEFAKFVLTEIIRDVEPSLLKAIRIEPVGSTDAVREAVRFLNSAGASAIGFRDGDKGSSPKDKLFSLPGSTPPELEVFRSPGVGAIFTETYGLDISEFMGMRTGIDHHEICDALAAETEEAPLVIGKLAASAYAHSLSAAVSGPIIQTVRAHA
jgi:predicted ATPase